MGRVWWETKGENIMLQTIVEELPCNMGGMAIHN